MQDKVDSGVTQRRSTPLRKGIVLAEVVRMQSRAAATSDTSESCRSDRRGRMIGRVQGEKVVNVRARGRGTDDRTSGMT